MGLKLIGEVSLDGSGFERGLEQIGHAATHNLKNLVAGAFGVYSIHQAIHRTIEAAEELVTTSKRLDTTVERLQVLRQAAKENNVEFSKLATKFDELNVAREKALGGGPEGTKVMAAFGRLGVTPEMLRTMSAADIFTGPMAGRARTTSIQDLDAPLKLIFKKGFGELIPLLKTDFDELGGKMAALGTIMDTQTAVAVKHLAEEFGLLSNIIVAQTAPALVSLSEFIINLVGSIKNLSAFFGGATGNIRPEALAGSASTAIVSPLFAIKDFWDQLTKGFEPGAGVMAYLKQEEVWEKMIDEMHRKLDELTNNLKNPPHPEQDTEASSAHKRAAALKAGDSLVSVGNFLGHTGISLQRMNERKVALLTQIANNTKPKPINLPLQLGLQMIMFPI